MYHKKSIPADMSSWKDNRNSSHDFNCNFVSLGVVQNSRSTSSQYMPLLSKSATVNNFGGKYLCSVRAHNQPK